MTKVLSAVRHQELCKTDFDLDAVPEASIMTNIALRRHAGWQSLGEITQLLSRLTCGQKSGQCFFCSRPVQKMF